MKLSQSLGAHVFRTQEYRILPRSQWLAATQRALRARGVPHTDRLFVYAARRTGQIKLGYWVKERPGGLLRAFVVLTSLNDRVPTADFLMHRLRPARMQAREGMRAIQEEEWKEREERRMEEEMKAEYVKWLRSRDSETARGIATGMIPVSFKQTEAVSDALRRLNPKVSVMPGG